MLAARRGPAGGDGAGGIVAAITDAAPETVPMAFAPQIEPERFAVEDRAGIKHSLQTNGYAVVTDAATPAELQTARVLLWQHLSEQHGWDVKNPKTWTDDAYAWNWETGGHGLSGNPRSGLLASTVRSTQSHTLTPASLISELQHLNSLCLP